MTGRGIDQALSQPLNPRLYEPYFSDARAYVELAENANGPIPRPVGFDYIWGEALPELRRAEVDLRIINLETAITTVETHWLGKEIHYRMHPHNIDCLSVAGINGCALANNHVLDWGYEGLSETLRTLDAVGVKHAGAGNATEDERLRRCSTCQGSAACFSSRLDRQPAGFRISGAPQAFARE